MGTSFEHPYPKHWHEEFFVSAITGGVGHFNFGGSHHLATPGSLVMVVPGEVHTHHSGQGGRSFRSLHLPWPYLEKAAAEFTEHRTVLPEVSSSVVSDETAFRKFLLLHHALERCETKLEHETVFMQLLETLLEQVIKIRLPVTGVEKEVQAVRLARQYLEEHFQREVTLKELSAQVNLSPYHLHRSFCRQIGIPPHAYQIQLRLLRAKALLRKRWPLSHVAYAAGFADQSHLTRIFKRFTGTTPARYFV